MTDPANHMSDRPDAPTVVTNPKAKTMAEQPQTVRTRSKRPRMADTPTPRRDVPGEHMKPFRAATSDPPAPDEYPPMRPAEHAGTAAGAAPARSGRRDNDDGYLRLRLRLENDTLTLVGMKAVEGPLVEHRHLATEHAYEISVGQQRVATGPVPDLGPNRAFPPEGSPPGQPGHAFTTPSYQEVVVRVPRRSLSLANLPRTSVSLLRIKEGPVTLPPMAAAPGPTADAQPRAVREVTRLAGIDLDDLPDDVRAEVLDALR